jgi:hypothetical protein
MDDEKEGARSRQQDGDKHQLWAAGPRVGRAARLRRPMGRGRRMLAHRSNMGLIRLLEEIGLYRTVGLMPATALACAEDGLVMVQAPATGDNGVVTKGVGNAASECEA